jgi:N utilization substance protein A
VTTAMMVALGKADIKTLEDLAYCAADDLVGWTERKDGENVRFEGALSATEVSREEAEGIVMAARLKAGIITEADLAPPPAAETPAEAEAATV